MKITVYQLAYRELLFCASPIGIVAGTHHFVDLWARDSLFATFGANAVGKFSLARRTIQTFLDYQRHDGLIPYLIERSRLTPGKYLFGKHSFFPSPHPAFRSHQSGGLVLDGGLMTIIAMNEYMRQASDTAFLRKYYVKLKGAIDWYQARFNDGLISEWFQCEWADAVLKIGRTLYTNTLYFQALRCMSFLAGRVGDGKGKNKYQEDAKRIQEQIQHTFWTGKYFADWIDYKRHDYFASHPNMLAILFGLPDKKQADAILNHAKIHCWNSFTLETNAPRYPFWRIPLFHHAIDMADYHNRGCLWLQPGILYAVALNQTGKVKEAKTVLEAIEKKIVEYQGVYEVYEKNGSPVDRLFYKSEHPFAWSAGLYLYAYKIIRKCYYVTMVI